MKKFLLVALVFVISCNGKENKVDSAVNREISEKINSIPTLWKKTEAHFFQRIADLGLMENKDSTEAFYNLIIYVQDFGYPDSFFVDKSDKSTQKLLNDLNQIGFRSDEESAHKFLYEICNPIVKSYGLNDSTNLISNFGRTNPDSIGFNFRLGAAHMPTQVFRRPNLNDPGLRKLLTLFYFSEMIKEKQ